MILEGRMRNPFAPPDGDTIITGIQFKKLENDLEGRKVMSQLTRLLGELQREEIRRMRLGLALTQSSPTCSVTPMPPAWGSSHIVKVNFPAERSR